MSFIRDRVLFKGVEMCRLFVTEYCLKGQRSVVVRGRTLFKGAEIYRLFVIEYCLKSAEICPCPGSDTV